MSKAGAVGVILSALIVAGCGAPQDEESKSVQVSEEYLKAVDEKDWEQACALYTPGHRKALSGSPTNPVSTCEKSEEFASSMAESQGLQYRLRSRTDDLALEGNETNNTAEVNIKGDNAIQLTLKKVDGKWLIEKVSGLYARD